MIRSPYAAPRRRPRWPWYAGIVAVLALIAFAGVAASTGPFTDGGSAVNQLALNQPTSTATGAAAAPTATIAPTPTPSPEPTGASDNGDAPLRTAGTWFSRWASEDFAGMYRLTSDSTRTVVSEGEFVDRYQTIMAEAGIKSVSGKVTGDATSDGRYLYTVTYESSHIGDYTETNTMHLVQEDDGWRVAWNPSLIFSKLGDTGCIAWHGEQLRRGSILDAGGEVLARDAEVARVGVVPGDLTDEGATIDQLAAIIDMDPDDIRDMYQREGTGPNWFVPLKHFPADQATSLLNQVNGMAGVTVKSGYARVYPHGRLFAHVTGYVSPATGEDVLDDDTGAVQPNEMVGRTGLEYGANRLLAGKPGGTLSVVECDTGAERDVITGVEGEPPLDIRISIDIDFQKKVDAAVGDVNQLASVPSGNVSENTEQERGSAVVIDPQTGAILAMVSHPTYDPNNFVNGSFSDEELTYLNDQTLAPQLNRATSGLYPAGSIFKVVTTAAAMVDLGFVGDTGINCPASFSIGDQTWDDWVVENGLSAQGMLTLHTGLVRSCNTVFYQIGAKLDYKDSSLLPDMAKTFGLGAPTGIRYFPEASGVVPDPQWKRENVNDGWSTGDSVTLAIGQDYLLVTPLQMANAYTAIANGGDLLKPWIVDTATVAGTERTKQIGKRKVLRQLPLDEAQMAELQSALRDQTTNDFGVGSSRIFNDFDWPISGKTGTAQDSGRPPHSWFAAYGPPGGDATVASIVMFENVGEGVQYAAPVTEAIYRDYVNSNLAATEP